MLDIDKLLQNGRLSPDYANKEALKALRQITPKSIVITQPGKNALPVKHRQPETNNDADFIYWYMMYQSFYKDKNVVFKESNPERVVFHSKIEEDTPNPRAHEHKNPLEDKAPCQTKSSSSDTGTGSLHSWHSSGSSSSERNNTTGNQDPWDSPRLSRSERNNTTEDQDPWDSPRLSRSERNNTAGNQDPWDTRSSSRVSSSTDSWQSSGSSSSGSSDDSSDSD